MHSSVHNNPILTTTQKLVLEYVSKHPIAEAYHLAGGTAISAFYLKHRLSEDLDFFSALPWKLAEIEKTVQGLPGLRKQGLSSLYDRRLFFLEFQDGSSVKVEFSKFDFPLLEPLQTIFGKMQVESLRDLFAGKLAAMIDRTEARDYFDVYAILCAANKPEQQLEQAIQDAEKKFGLPNFLPLVQQAFARCSQISNWPDLFPRWNAAEANQRFLGWAKHLVK